MNARISIKPFTRRLEALQKEAEEIEKSISELIDKKSITRRVDFVLQDPLDLCTHEYIELASKNINVEWNNVGSFAAGNFLANGEYLMIGALQADRNCHSILDAISDKINEEFVRKVLTDKSGTLKLFLKYFLESFDDESSFVRVKFDPPEDETGYIRWPSDTATAKWEDFFDKEEDKEEMDRLLIKLTQNKTSQNAAKNAIEKIKEFVFTVITPAIFK